jgi:hypothetical protein
MKYKLGAPSGLSLHRFQQVLCGADPDLDETTTLLHHQSVLKFISAFRSLTNRVTTDFVPIMDDFSSGASVLDVSDYSTDLQSVFKFIFTQLCQSYLPEPFIAALIRCFVSLSYQQDEPLLYVLVERG